MTRGKVQSRRPPKGDTRIRFLQFLVTRRQTAKEKKLLKKNVIQKENFPMSLKRCVRIRAESAPTRSGPGSEGVAGAGSRAQGTKSSPPSLPRVLAARPSPVAWRTAPLRAAPARPLARPPLTCRLVASRSLGRRRERLPGAAWRPLPAAEPLPRRRGCRTPAPLALRRPRRDAEASWGRGGGARA